MKTIVYYYFFILLLLITACSSNKNTFIIARDTEANVVAQDLAAYLQKTYPNQLFVISNEESESNKNIVLELVSDGMKNDEAFKITGFDNSLKIEGQTVRALYHGSYGLLKELGWNFYLSFEVPPSHPKPLAFSEILIENEPLKEKRIIFNWHNFLSGCTGWDYQQWEEWIDNSSKIGFNTVMVHAYGNNPMQSFSLNGQEKELGYLTTSLKGRDWGAQHVNDIRLMYGGHIYTDFEYGSNAAKVAEEERSAAATSMMQKVFKHAANKSMDVCFAIDIDTWMANPQNLINTLPEEALIKIGGYNTANPEHPEGKKYYEAQLKKLLSDYPEIKMLAAWMRMPAKNPGLGSIWLKHDSNTLPAEWKKEYFGILKKHPELKDEKPYPGLFAISKIVEVYRQILDELRPDVELVLGSWRLNYPKQADPFMPEYCGFIPLDWQVIFEKNEILDELAEVGKNRKLYPIVWAHHDDHRYVGRPYQPWEDFNTKLNRINAPGYGIIHWTTHPLDLYFNNTEKQVWKNTENEKWENTIEKFARSMQVEKDENLVNYYKIWFKNAPMFGRETSDYFIRPNEDYHLEGYNSSEEVVENAKLRLDILNNVNTGNLNSKGIKEYNYQVGMEEFLISFFQNHSQIYRAFQFLEDGKITDAGSLVQKTDPGKTIEIFAKTISDFGATRGEEGLLLSLNLRWLPDYIDIRQRTRKEAVRINFQPTSHDPLAQGAGKHTYFIDSERKFWHAKGSKELGINSFTNGNTPLTDVKDSWIEINQQVEIPLKTMRNYNLSAGPYNLGMIYKGKEAEGKIKIFQKGIEISSGSGNSISFNSDGGDLMLQVTPVREKMSIAGLIIHAD